jgi:hypothetical protein
MATNDFTNWGLFWYSYYKNPKNFFDSSVQTIMGNAYYTHFLYRIFSRSGSAVNSGTTNMLMSYDCDTSFIKSIDDDDIPDDMKRTAIAERFRAASLFFAHLSSVVYESRDIILKVANKWGIEVQTIQKIDHSSAAYIFTVNRKNENAVVLVFKGTSPFNLTEWASNFGIGLVRPNDELCNRDASDDTRIHGGFWNTIFGNFEGQHDHKYWNSIVEAVNVAVNKISGETNAKVPVYVTGHSLGAALASVALSVLAWSPEQLSKKAKLVGAFTYGTPNVGNDTFKDKYNQNLQARDIKHFRIGNANDIVYMVPRTLHNGGIAITLNHNTIPILGEPSIFRKIINYSSALLSFPQTCRSLCNEFMEVKPKKSEIENKNLTQTEYYVNNLLTSDITNYDEQESYDKKTNALGYCYKAIAPSWLLDHFPSEYIEHIDKAKWSALPYKSLKF